MDFFAAQEAAKQRTRWAVALFALGVLTTALFVWAAGVWAVTWVHPQATWGARTEMTLHEFALLPVDVAQRCPKYFALAIFTTIGGMLLASWWKMSELGAGGLAVAQSVGARILDLNTTDEKERRLVNVVEEMALAAGTPVPVVGVMDKEYNINAFAAMKSPHDAVIVVTRGALEGFTREELQAVVGHEFSHLLNGDSRMNVNLAGWVWGLFFVTVVGRIILQGRPDSSNESRRGGINIAFGILLLVVGMIGHLVGRLIQALISRQREYLADAAAVQFTRNPLAMLKALNKLRAGTKIAAPAGSSLAHFFFAPAQALNGLTGLLATHPALDARMKAIDENYEAALLPDALTQEIESAHQASAQHPIPLNVGELTLMGILAGVGSAHAGTQTQEKNADEPWEDALKTSEGAQAVLLVLALPSAERHATLKDLEGRLEGKVLRWVYDLEGLALASEKRWQLAQRAVGRLRAMEVTARLNFCQVMESWVNADSQRSARKVLLLEWLRHVLGMAPRQNKFPPEEAASRLLGYLYAAQKEAGAFDAAALEKVLAGLALKDLRALGYVSVKDLDEALPALRGYNFILRRELLIAVGRVLQLDKVVTEEELEILRWVAGIMDCPLPTKVGL